MKEIWKDIKNYEGIYKISSLGNILSLRTNRLLRQELHKGYYEVNLCKNGIVKHNRVHIIVAKSFIPNPYNKKEVNHIDGNKANNCINNLEWVSHKENMKHARKNNLFSNEGIYKSVNAMVNATKKPILQIKSGIIIKEYESISQAIRETKITHIYNVLNGTRKLAGGYFWKYK